MATQGRREDKLQIQTTEQRPVVKKRKMSQNDVVQSQVPQEVEAKVVGLGEEISAEGLRMLPWWPSDMIDERMSWSMVWLPSWDADFIGRAYHLLYDDVAWDDDIWGLKSIHEIPKPRL